ncbi:MAG TPA: double-strand break repair helicase AddA [Rhodopila sp.]|uniref:double-strand break repair helicase AddA n=1 Tax=Rhodopila sp. TaxID=2480087 RepID=UPI002CA63BF4|nr:double-strand break repair helicase AddA [Rhodopila sp.]HVY13809.1 double-strand break repair helicase AddA [Rhodopila sp.]
MSASARDRANARQAEASDPAVSSFVEASAGSGKTKLLTDRLLRLMLAGTRPDRIQCLTFTKAAAAEMAVRLQKTLGRWVAMPQPALEAALRDLHVEPTEEACRTARALFATVLDLPGGMRIGTIHAFSQSLLRRFPLEAAISPHFQLVDERDSREALTEAREDMLAAADTPAMVQALRTLAGLTSADRFGELVQSIQADRTRLAAALRLGDDLERAQRRVLGVTATDDAACLESAVHWQGEAALHDAAAIVSRQGTKTSIARAEDILGWLSLDTEARMENWDHWVRLFLKADGEPYAAGTVVGPSLSKQQSELGDRYREEADRILRIEDDRRALRLAAVSAALALLAGPVAEAYEERKQHAGLLDYDDLIDRTKGLLLDPGVAWVLYKLDGGLDHLLLDEVQDTSPQQWQIAHTLTAEFFNGTGAREDNRTVFAVGDRKQSIYSFQGADAAEFDRSRQRIERRVTESGNPFKPVGLDVSFRSTDPVLRLVDAVFADPIAGAGVVTPGQTLTHLASRAGHAGLVELWPLAPRPDSTPAEPWTVPQQNQTQTSARETLANRLADWIGEQTGGTAMLESKGRPLAPGDVLVLVRRRDAFSRALLRALKTRGVPVAGLDRMVLTDQPAVQDLMALADALLLPSDDLTFGCFLTSPLGGLTDDEMMALALERPGSLWDALRDRAGERPRWRAAADFFAKLLGRIDFVSPYALFAYALGPLGGRARLLGRLGPEAAEPVDELLNAALTYAARHPPSMQGFLHWMRQSGAEVKREAEAAGNLVRIMTVHGAKGLQAPLVIVPDTTALPQEDADILWSRDPATGIDVPLWAVRKDHRCRAFDALRAERSRAQMEEHNRLLYVALTRAEDRLVVCGWAGRTLKDESWHSAVQRGFERLDVERAPFDAWPGDVLRFRSSQLAAPETRAELGDAGEAAALPAWIGSAPDWTPADPPAEPARPVPLAPSRPEGAEFGEVPPGDSPLADGVDRFRRGQLVHALLQHLPSLPEAERHAAAIRYVARSGFPADQAGAIAAEVLGVMAHPDLAALFGPGSRPEVPLTGVVGDSVIGGLVDRLAVTPNCVLIGDFKTNRTPPTRVEDTPVMYLRQMASYRAVLRAIFPDRPVRCALIWTRTARVSVLPDALLDPHEPGRPRDAA